MSPGFLIVLLFLLAASIAGFIVWLLATLAYFRIFPRNLRPDFRTAAGACSIILSPVASLVLTAPLLDASTGFFLGPVAVVIFLILRRNRRIASAQKLNAASHDMIAPT